LGDSPMSEFYLLMFRKTLSVTGRVHMTCDKTECSERSAVKNTGNGESPKRKNTTRKK